MWPWKKPIERVSQSLLFSVTIFVGSSLLPEKASSQSCSGTLKSIVYDTTYTSNNTGGNSTFTYNLPQFPVSASSLYAVSVKSVLTVNLTATIQNNTGSTVNATLKIVRNDDVNSTPTGDVNNTVLPLPTFNANGLVPGGTKTIGPGNAITTVPILNDSIDASASNFSQFTGGGTIPITYSASTTLVPAPSGVNLVSSTIVDKMRFTITYYYCDPGVLASDILTFTATRQNDGTAILNWTATNEEKGKVYALQVSEDGKTFSNFATQAANTDNINAGYSQIYTISPSSKDKLYFRVEVISSNGMSSYSPIRIIDLDPATGTGFSIYPNPPSDYINVSFPGNLQNWQVDIIAADGSTIQRSYYRNSSNVKVSFIRRLASGAYFVRAANPQSGKHYTGSFIIR